MKARTLFKLNSLKPFLPMLFASILLAAARQGWNLYLHSLRGPLGLFSIPLIGCPFLVLGGGFALALIFLVIRSIHNTSSLLPTVSLLVGIIVAFSLPLPQPPDTPEKQHFIEDRADYESAVELARQGELQPSHECGTGFKPPTALHHISAADCMFTYHDQERGLVVFFYPLERAHLVAYVEFDETEYPCGRAPFVEQKIEPHWYVCQDEWN